LKASIGIQNTDPDLKHCLKAKHNSTFICVGENYTRTNFLKRGESILVGTSLFWLSSSDICSGRREGLGGESVVGVLHVLLEVAGGGEREGAQLALDSLLQMLRLDMVHHVRGFLTGLHSQISPQLPNQKCAGFDYVKQRPYSTYTVLLCF
jgi:hypothetical protein